MALYVNYTLTEEQADGSIRKQDRSVGPYDSWKIASEHAQDIGSYTGISNVEIESKPRAAA